jgi:hypothetical protein
MLKPQYRVNLKDLQAIRDLKCQILHAPAAVYSCPRTFRLMTSSMVVVAAAAWRW